MNPTVQKNDICKRLEKLTDEVQATNTRYIMQENQLSQRTKYFFLAAVFLVILMLTPLVLMQNHLIQEQARFSQVALSRVTTLYQEQPTTILVGEKMVSNHDIEWPAFASEHGGLENIALVTRSCSDKNWLGHCHRFDYSYQAHFKDGAVSMTFGATLHSNLTADKFDISLTNPQGGAMLLKQPTPFTVK